MQLLLTASFNRCRHIDGAAGLLSGSGFTGSNRMIHFVAGHKEAESTVPKPSRPYCTGGRVLSADCTGPNPLRSDTQKALMAEPELVSAVYIDAHSTNLFISHLQPTRPFRGTGTGTTRHQRRMSGKPLGLFAWGVKRPKDDRGETIIRL